MSGSRFSSGGGSCRRMRVVAVTGPGGKTTTAWLAASVLAEAGLHVGVVSDLGCVDADGSLVAPPDLGRPGAWGGWVERLADGGCTHAVIEVPLAALANAMVGPDACDVVVVTGASRAGQPGAPAFSRHIAAALAPGGCLVAPDLPRLAPVFAAAARRGGRTCLTAGLDGACDVSARPVSRGLHGQTFLAAAAGQVVAVSVDPPVASFARNAMCAAAVGLFHGVPLHVAARGIEAAGAVAGRVERLDRGQDFVAFLDTPPDCHTLASTLASLRRLTPGRLAVVAEQRFVDRLGVDGFAGPVRRRCDEVVVAPDGVLADDPDEAAVAAYARIDRLLGRLGADDCLLVLEGGGTAPRDGGAALATLVDGWLRLACPPRTVARRAA